MMPILVKSDDVRRGKKAKVRHGRLRTGVKGLIKTYTLQTKGTFLWGDLDQDQ